MINIVKCKRSAKFARYDLELDGTYLGHVLTYTTGVIYFCQFGQFVMTRTTGISNYSLSSDKNDALNISRSDYAVEMINKLQKLTTVEQIEAHAGSIISEYYSLLLSPVTNEELVFAKLKG